jgi:predicted enzyme related to lactoylglutathione lyase
MTRHSIVHIEISTSDGQASAEFYHGLFGWKIEAHPLPTDPDRKVWQYTPREGPGGLFLELSDGKEDGRLVAPGDVLVYVTTDDVAGTLARAEALGGKVVIPSRENTAGMSWGMFTDPTGNRIGVVQAADQS